MDGDGRVAEQGDDDRGVNGGSRRVSSLRYSILFKYKVNYVNYIVKTDHSWFLDQTELQKTAENQFLVV